MSTQKMKKNSLTFKIAKTPFSRFGKALLFLSVAVLMTALITAPCMARQNDPLPSEAMAAIAKSISKDLPATYNIEKVGDGYAVENRSHKMKMSFSHDEIRFCKMNTDDSYALTLTGIGYDTLETPPPAEIKALGNRIEFRRGDNLTEWYLNTPLGLEQGFTLDSPPGNPAGDSHARLELTLQGSLDAVLLDDRTLAFKNSAGKTVTRYAGLYVFDADKKSLPARLQMRNDKLIICFDDSHARYPVTVDPWIQQVKLTAGDAAASDYFGCSVAVSGDTAVVGASHDDDAGDYSGSAYVFERDNGTDNWGLAAKLTADDAAAWDFFGCSVAVSGDTAVVGARYGDDDDGDDSGSAYVFKRDHGGDDNWGQAAKLTADNATALPAAGAHLLESFGWSVAVSGDTAVVGAHGNDHGGSDSGSAYVFVKPAGGWIDMTQTAKLTADDAAAHDRFGRSVSVSGDTAVVGTSGGDSSDSAYVFVKPADGWIDMTQTAKLTAADAAADDNFGSSVAVSGDTAVVGAYDDDDGGHRSGSAYVFEKGTEWTNGNGNQTAKLTATDAAAYGFFGWSVSVSGDTAVVGAFGDSGSAYVFVKPAGGWIDMTQTAKLTADDAAADDNFGSSVAVSGDTAVVGAYLDDDGGSDSGSAYVFAIPTTEGDLDIVDSSAPCGGSVSVPVRIQNAPNMVNALGFEVTYDSAMLTYTGFEKGPLSVNFADPAGDFDVNPYSPGAIRIGGYRSFDGIAPGAGGVLVYLKFNIAVVCVSSVLEIAALTDDIGSWTATSGSFTPGSVTVCDGDVNGDGDITPADALCVFEKYMTICKTSCGIECEDLCGDVNGDGETTPADALCIFNKYLGKTSCLD
ncbi:cohesin domain-containing protein [Desulfococcaceae bacterium HSG9]|nr:cohesin domain-containing protein [Desulfococcaceae bacterium HSG9]